jgi:hypothetical protein
MRQLNFNTSTVLLILALLTGLGLGLYYSWFYSPVTYVDANPAILRADFKDQYRVVIAASYASNQDLARANARLSLLGDVDPIAELSAQAQRLLASGEPFDKVRPLAQLATDLQLGYVSNPIIATPFNALPTVVAVEETEPSSNVTEEAQDPSIPTVFFEQTPLIPIFSITLTPRPATAAIPLSGTPFTLVGQDIVCEPGSTSGLLQFNFTDARRKEIAGVEIILTWEQGEDKFFTGFKPELGDGYADFLMEASTIYNVRVVTGGGVAQNIFAPTCTDPNGAEYLGGILLSFQRP